MKLDNTEKNMNLFNSEKRLNQVILKRVNDIISPEQHPFVFIFILSSDVFIHAKTYHKQDIAGSRAMIVDSVSM